MKSYNQPKTVVLLNMVNIYMQFVASGSVGTEDGNEQAQSGFLN